MYTTLTELQPTLLHNGFQKTFFFMYVCVEVATITLYAGAHNACNYNCMWCLHNNLEQPEFICQYQRRGGKQYILLAHCTLTINNISEANTVLCTPLQPSENLSYKLLCRFILYHKTHVNHLSPVLYFIYKIKIADLHTPGASRCDAFVSL